MIEKLGLQMYTIRDYINDKELTEKKLFDILTKVKAMGYDEIQVAGNTVLETLELPKSIVYIGAYAFSGCTSLAGVKFNAYDNWHVSIFEDLAFPPSHYPSSDPAKNAEELTGYYGEWYWFVKDPYS